MEATNISIKQQSSVSINVETLQAIRQHLWFMVHGVWLMVLCLAKRQGRAKGSMSLPRLYRQELRLARAVARAIDAHPTISNIALWVQTFVGIYLIFMYA